VAKLFRKCENFQTSSYEKSKYILHEVQFLQTLCHLGDNYENTAESERPQHIVHRHTQFLSDN